MGAHVGVEVVDARGLAPLAERAVERRVRAQLERDALRRRRPQRREGVVERAVGHEPAQLERERRLVGRDARRAHVVAHATEVVAVAVHEQREQRIVRARRERGVRAVEERGGGHVAVPAHSFSCLAAVRAAYLRAA